MKKFLMTCMAAGTLLSATAQTVAPAIPRDEKIEQRVEEILGKMTLDEKIAKGKTNVKATLVGSDENPEYSVPVLYDAQENLVLAVDRDPDGAKVQLNLEPEEKPLSKGTDNEVSYVLIQDVGSALQRENLSSIFDLNYKDTKRTTYSLSVTNGDCPLVVMRVLI